MKTKTARMKFHPMLGAALLAAFSMLSFTPASQAKDKGGKGGHGKGGHSHHGNPHHDHDHAQQVYHSHPVAKFKLNKGNGYAGPGYYYGPANVPYYYERPGVVFYPHHGAIPPQYRSQSVYRMNSDDYRVQQALARLGYYQGPIDGQFGPQSYRALNSYQQAQGLPVSNVITAVVLRALGLQ